MKIGQFVEANLAWILSGALALYTGYVVGESKTTSRMDRMAEHIQELRAENIRRRKFEQCLVANVANADVPKIKVLECLAE